MSLPETRLKMNYIALGDSITHGLNASSRDHAYPSRITSMLKSKGIQTKLSVIAEPGWTSTNLLEKIHRDPSFLGRAQMVTVWIGGNDLIQYGLSSLLDPSAPIQEMMNRYRKNLDRILGIVRKMGVEHIICCSQYNPFPNSEIAVNAIRIMNQLIRASAATNRCLVARVDRWFYGNEKSLIYGYRSGQVEDALRGYAAVHPNDQGHEVIAKRLFSLINPLIRR